MRLVRCAADRPRAAARYRESRPPGDEPPALLGNADRHHLVTAAVDCLKDRSGREQGDFMFAATPAKKYAHPKFLLPAVLILWVFDSSGRQPKLHLLVRPLWFPNKGPGAPKCQPILSSLM